jgi:hypothetical protein
MRPPPQGPPGDDESRGQGAVIDPKDVDAVDSRVEELTRELAQAINQAEADGRVVMRDYAIDLLRDSVTPEVDGADDESTATGPAAAPLNPFALGIPVLLIGVVLTFIFTPVGVALLLLGVVLCTIGVAMAVFRSTRERWRSRGDVQ